MRRNALALTAIVTFTPAAFGQTFHVRVERSSTSPCVGGVEHDQDHPANQPLSLALSTCALRVIITASTSVNIPRITLTNGPTWPVQISLGSTFSQIGADPTPQGDDWAGLNASGLTTSQFYGGIQGDLTDSILVDQLFRFDAEGAVNAAITAGAVGSSGICIVSAGSIGSSGSVTVTNGDIVEVETIGNMAGSIVSTNDSIDPGVDGAWLPRSLRHGPAAELFYAVIVGGDPSRRSGS